MTFSYHDLHITTETMDRTSICDLPFDVQVMCTRSGGWEIWRRPDEDGEQEVLAGEFSNDRLRLDVGGVVIVDTLTPQEET